ncbi:hypothetical protein IGL98_000828 [Enterococcus sp. DIV0840]|uniref:lipopolysaccharide biosynthesis protein n=1 Tax=Enterococcus TaxID=1350 RepID=UPI001A9092BD|nr:MULTISPECIES: polysaccharide biosynthesis C-terminal domain-containing protein [Enterococcus]MBO0434088.1 polysaccharide biosynthesis C-terminal domain-containing protein [Enterococcus sp. DIV0849a]MBO0472993.1 polysaccharide biosynthesis C-terminal domain-containing protein [Enterococcus ureasiticus]
MENNKYKKLLGNSAIFAIGNFGSKIISIIFVPIYTYALTTQEYGQIDLLTTTVSLFLPIITLSLYEAVLRFIMDKNSNEKAILSSSVIVISMISLCILMVGIITKLDKLLFYFIILLILQAYQSVFSQFIRGVGKIKIYAFNGILMTFTTVLSNVLLLIYFKLGIDGYMLSLIIANLTSIFYLLIVGKLKKFLSINDFNIPLIKKMLVYSAPLVPNMIMWWLINSSTRYFILYYIGASANGIYAVANKIPALISTVTTIFAQAWQLSAIEEFDAEDKSTFYSNTFSFYYQVLFISASLVFSVLKPVLGKVLQDSYYSSWQIAPILVLAVLYSSFSSFLGTNYIAAKKTRGVFISSVIGAVCSVSLNLILIPLFGLMGAGIASTISFFVMWIIRLYDTKKYIVTKIDWTNFVGNNLILICQIIIMFIFDMWSLLVLEFILVVVLLVMNRKIVSKIFTESLKYIKLVSKKAK